MMKRNIKQQLNAKLTEMNMNLANNYKDLAHDALKELDWLITIIKMVSAHFHNLFFQFLYYLFL